MTTGDPDLRRGEKRSFWLENLTKSTKFPPIETRHKTGRARERERSKEK